MNFFERQDKARKQTLILLFFYVLAVVATILSVYGAARFSWYLFRYYSASRSSYSDTLLPISFQMWDPRFFWIVTGIVCLVVLLGAIAKIMELSSGGSSVAKMLGGEQILPNTSDPDERKVLNVVEEMSIASGVPVPPVFLLKNELGINAFAAGFSAQDAVIGVTQGAVKLLSRDELQGVIAHEFSHIFNGDMRLNMNLTGFLNGLLLIALTGKGILRGFGRGRVRSSGRGGGAAIIGIILFAVLLVAVGYIGVFFCNWIKSCVSRQRELLADASSAQYTRNPAGLAGALKKIGGLADGSFLEEVKAEEVSHFFFADGITSLGVMTFPTHPPLDLRIKLLDPSFDGKYPAVRSIVPGVSEKQRTRQPTPQLDQKAAEWEKKIAIFQTPLAVATQASLADSVVSSVGTMKEARVEKAVQILGQLPKSLREAAMSLSGAVVLVYGLLIDRLNMQVRTRQLEYLSQHADPAVYQSLLKLLPDFSSLEIGFCLPLLDLATPALKTQSPALYDVFKKNLEALINTDGSVTIFEFALKQVVLHHLDYFFGKTKKPVPVYASIGQVLPSGEVLLSYLAGAGHLFRPSAEAAFAKASKELDPAKEWKYIPPQELMQNKVEEALPVMASTFPKVKEQFLRACVTCVEQDGKLDVREMELLRAFAATLDCPIPPFSIAP